MEKFTQFGKKIVCVGRNYKALAAEQGLPVPDIPIIFLKPTTSYIAEGQDIEVPPMCADLFHEVELGLVIGKKGKNIKEEDAMDHIAGYALVLDMTARNLQLEAKANGHPWVLSKGFDTACPVSPYIPKEKLPDINDVRLWLNINGTSVQDSNTSAMIFNVPFLVSFISKFFTLELGDLIITGSPAGAGPVFAGDVIEAGLGDVMSMKFKVVDPQNVPSDSCCG